jgi:hypothetical protein
VERPRSGDRCAEDGGCALERTGVWWLDVPATTAAQYGRLVEALIDAGEAGVAWRVTLDYV